MSVSPALTWKVEAGGSKLQSRPDPHSKVEANLGYRRQNKTKQRKGKLERLKDSIPEE